MDAPVSPRKPLFHIEADWKRLAAIFLLVLLVGSISGLVYVQLSTQIPTQILLAHYARFMAGEPVAFDAQYLPGEEAFSAWNMVTNSEWLDHRTTLIVPYFAYEGMTYEGVYPQVAGFLPYGNQRSFHIAGFANVFPYNLVMLNERFILDPEWNDEREALLTLTHELIHIQGGQFMFSDLRESYTAAATTEILAAMCNYGDKIACKAFWMDIEGKARSYIRVVAHKYDLDWLYKAWVDRFFVTNQARTDKGRRYWAQQENPDDLYDIVEKYDVYPYKFIIIPGVQLDWKMDTGIQVFVFNGLWYDIDPSSKVLQLAFDDTRYLLGFWKWTFWTGYMK